MNKYRGLPEILAWAEKRYEDRIAFATSLGLEDQVIVDAIAKKGISIPIFTLDTGRLFTETYELLAKTEAKYDIKIKVIFPDTCEIESMVEKHGINLFRNSVKLRRECCRVRKVEPLKRGLSGQLAWITGLRREQAESREGLELVEWDEAHEITKINPLTEWSKDEVWSYIKDHKVPYNPLHDQGYPSIGCACCTRAIDSKEDIRAGRWWWEHEEKKECGLHGYKTKGQNRADD